jgi:hypothetical protein
MADRLGGDARAPQWVQTLREEIERRFEGLFQKPFALKPYDSAAMPPAARFRGCLVYVSDTDLPAVSNGTDWRYFDGSAV